MVNTCDSCRYWGEPLGEKNEFAQCQNPKMQGDRRPEIDGVAEADTMGYSPAIYFGAKFGCIHYQAK